MNSIEERLQKKCVGIAGCGGLGSNCAVALARSGIGKLIIADFDVVSLANLNRQYYFRDQVGWKKVEALKENIRRISNRVEIETHDVKLDPPMILKIFVSCDAIVEAFDLAEMKRMLMETVLEFLPGKPIVAGIGLAGFGYSDELKTQSFGNLYICGDQNREVSSTMPPLAPRVGIVAHMQANQILEILLKAPS